MIHQVSSVQFVLLQSSEVLTSLEVWREWVGEPHVSGECGQDEVAHLDAVGWDDVSKDVVMVTEELWEVMQQHQQHPKCPLLCNKAKHRNTHWRLSLV